MMMDDCRVSKNMFGGLITLYRTLMLAGNFYKAKVIEYCEHWTFGELLWRLWVWPGPGTGAATGVPAPAQPRPASSQPGQTIFYSSFIDLIWSWPSATTQPETAGIAAENMFTKIQISNPVNLQALNAIAFLTVCNKLRSPGIATVAMQQLGTCPLLFWDIINNRRIEKDPFSSSLNLLFIIHIYPDKMWCVVHSVYYREICNDDKDTNSSTATVKVKFSV